MGHLVNGPPCTCQWTPPFERRNMAPFANAPPPLERKNMAQAIDTGGGGVVGTPPPCLAQTEG